MAGVDDNGPPTGKRTRTVTPAEGIDVESLPLVLEKGTSVGRYLVLGPLGQGGMGAVFAAYDPGLDRKVALKLLSADVESSESTAGQTRLLREAQAMAGLRHQNVATVYDVGTHEDRVFMAMELVDGGTLGQW